MGHRYAVDHEGTVTRATYSDRVTDLPSTTLDAAMHALAKRAEAAQDATTAASYALAVLRLAEALAWVAAPDQSHGGSGSMSSGE